MPRPIDRTNSPRFEIVHTRHGCRGRYLTGNGTQMWTTDVLANERAVLDAISLIAPSLAGLPITHTHT